MNSFLVRVMLAVFTIATMVSVAFPAVTQQDVDAALAAFNSTKSTAEADSLLADPSIEEQHYLNLMQDVKVIDAFAKKDIAAVNAYVAEVTAPNRVSIVSRVKFLRFVSNEFWRISDKEAALATIDLALADPEMESQSDPQIQALMYKVTYLRKMHRYDEAIAVAQGVASLPIEGRERYVMDANKRILMMATASQHDAETMVAVANSIFEIAEQYELPPNEEEEANRYAFEYLTAYHVRLNDQDALVSLMIKHLDLVQNPSQINPKLFAAAIPNDSVLQLWVLDANVVLERYKIHSRAKQGRINSKMMEQIVTQLDKGGDLRSFTLGATAALILDGINPDSIIYPYASAMLSGNFEEAIRLAHGYAINPDTTDEAYAGWMHAASAAIRCLDQAYNGRAVEFIRWANGETNQDGSAVANPVADILNL